jgi:diguanylate cyclase (GGDEF)-like protein
MPLFSPRTTIRAKLATGYAAAFALVAAVGVFGVVQLYRVNQVTREIREVWLPKIEALNKVKAALGEHRLLATRRVQATNFRHLAAIAKNMEIMRGIVDAETDAYVHASGPKAEAELLAFRSAWGRYQATLKSVEQAIEAGELTQAYGQFEKASLPEFHQAVGDLDRLIAAAKDRSTDAENRAQAVYDLALRLTFAVSALAAVAACAATFWTSRNVSLPIVQVSEAMRRLAEGDWTSEPGPTATRHDEIGVLIDAVNGYRTSLLRGRQLAEQAEIERQRLQAAVGNMPIGLAMFDAQRKLIICNARYAEMYQLPAALSVSGTPLESILQERVRTGVFVGTSSHKFIEDTYALIGQTEPILQLAELNDGRTFSIIYQPMAGGGWVSTHEDVTERRRAEARIQHMAGHDVLTDLPNRNLLKERIEAALKHVQRGQAIAVLCLDLDRFKPVNDTLGHPVGDRVLQAVADRLRASVRETDTVARFGGDEFAIVQTLAEQPQDATGLATRVIEALSAPYDIDGQQVVIGCSIGIALAPSDGEDADQLIKNADMALYRAKVDGRGTYRFFEPDMDLRMQARRALELDLRNALVGGEFELHYQPLIDLKRGTVSSFEALLRWNQPRRGMVPPADFIPLAEETGLIVPIGEWVLRRACADAATWPENIKVAVNLSPAQFKTDGIVRAVFSALATSGLSASRLELEITETVLLHKGEATMQILHQLRAFGVRMSMDDFGTGYSSLSYLRSFPFDKIKIDRSFIHDITDNNQSLAIVQAVTSLGTTLGMATTAEGVETREQLDRLRAQGCTEVQGYYFSTPKPARELPGLLSTIGGKIGIAA